MTPEHLNFRRPSPPPTGPVPPVSVMPTRWFCPTPGTDLRAVAANLSRLTADIDVFQFYAYPFLPGVVVPFCGENTHEHVRDLGLVSALYEARIPIAAEIAAVKVNQSDLVLIEGGRTILKAARAMGGRLTYLTMDEPFLAALEERNGLDHAASRVRRYIEGVRDVDADVLIGMVEAYPALSVDTILNALRALANTGVTLSHLHLDVDHNHVKQDNLDLTVALRTLRNQTNAMNIPFGVCVWGHNDQTDATWCHDARELLGAYQHAFGNWPATVITQSWSAGWQDAIPTPRSIPATTPETGDTLWSVQRDVTRRLQAGSLT